MKLGARILKTGIAITLALFLAEMFNLPSPVFAGIAAIFAIQPTIYRSYLSIVEQVQGNIIGAIIGIAFVLLFGNNIFIIGLAAIIVITINLKLKIGNTIALSLVTLIAIMEYTQGNFIDFAMIRFSTIMLGIFSAFIVNLVFLPPKYENKLYYKISGITEEVTKWIRLNTRNTAEHKVLKIDIEEIKEDIIKLDQLYLMYKEERNYLKRNDLAKSRKLVIYRQMITALKRSLQTLRRLHRFENELNHMPAPFQEAVQEQLDCLINHHEQLLLRFIGKIKYYSEHTENDICRNKKGLFDLFLAQQKELDDPDDALMYHTMQIVSAIIEYGEELEHLDLLISSFQSFHKDENEVAIEDEAEQ
ncbi:hypothetical protein CU633_18240 [Bacillus sp. V3-13]|uniref:FUSC family protein n=1 Tax=Bacillus sp. V3-13 TaxID=2053728 RepID=UPI000C76F55A|nr:aromatic acid exporter family protein [Bacillus sp. V3-13]PLR76005.1 hypothetical protein CU633_18240 [Bacillus sp. V3-13]